MKSPFENENLPEEGQEVCLDTSNPYLAKAIADLTKWGVSFNFNQTFTVTSVTEHKIVLVSQDKEIEVCLPIADFGGLGHRLN